MNWYSKPKVEAVEPSNNSDETPLAEAEKGYRAAELAFTDACLQVARFLKGHADGRLHMMNGELFARVNSMTAEPELQRLERARDGALRKRNELLKTRADLMLELGLTK